MLQKKISQHISQYLNIANIEDSSYNGLQVEGKEDVKKIAFAVDSGVEVFEKARAANADMLVVHHGLFWDRSDPRLIGAMKKRIDILRSTDMNFYAVHLPLDKHDEVGNNAQLIEIVGAKKSGKFYKYKGDFLGMLGKFDNPQNLADLAEILNEKLSTNCAILGADRQISTVAAISGGIGMEAVEFAHEAGADLLIVGEKRDFYHLANDLNISVIFAGHHASEQVGIWALQKHVQETFPELECVYIECKTGL